MTTAMIPNLETVLFAACLVFIFGVPLILAIDHIIREASHTIRVHTDLLVARMRADRGQS